MEKTVCLVCVLVSLSCLVFILLIGCILIISETDKKNHSLQADLDNIISKLQLELDRLNQRRELPLTRLTEKNKTVRRNYIFTDKYIRQPPKKGQKYFERLIIWINIFLM